MGKAADSVTHLSDLGFPRRLGIWLVGDVLSSILLHEPQALQRSTQLNEQARAIVLTFFAPHLTNIQFFFSFLFRNRASIKLLVLG